VGEPQRTCTGCRRVAPQRSLVRIALDGVRVVVDEDRRRPGRGAWLHRERACVQAAVKGGLARSFRRKVDPNALVEWASYLGRSGDPGIPQGPDRATTLETTLATATEKS
jgi:uncharacterized protein